MIGERPFWGMESWQKYRSARGVFHISLGGAENEHKILRGGLGCPLGNEDKFDHGLLLGLLAYIPWDGLDLGVACARKVVIQIRARFVLDRAWFGMEKPCQKGHMDDLFFSNQHPL